MAKDFKEADGNLEMLLTWFCRSLKRNGSGGGCSDGPGRWGSVTKETQKGLPLAVAGSPLSPSIEPTRDIVAVPHQMSKRVDERTIQ